MPESNAPRHPLAAELVQVAESARALRHALTQLNQTLPDDFPTDRLDALAASLVKVPGMSSDAAIHALFYAEARLGQIRLEQIGIAGVDLPDLPRGGAIDLATQRLMADVATARASYAEAVQDAAEASPIPETAVARGGTPEMAQFAERSADMASEAADLAEQVRGIANPDSIAADNLARRLTDTEILAVQQGQELDDPEPRPRLIDRLNRGLRMSVEYAILALEVVRPAIDIAKAGIERFAEASTRMTTVWFDAAKDFCDDVEMVLREYMPTEPPPLRPRLRPSEGEGPIEPDAAEIGPGTFLMGSPDKSLEADKKLFMAHGGTEEEWEGLYEGDDVERPYHEVRIDYRLIVSRYPVTIEEYDRFAEATGRDPPPVEGRGRGRRPVTNVSWDDAKAYAGWLAKETGEPWRLLSESEWEYACRAGTRTSYYWGNCEPTKRDANFGRNVDKTTEVGSYPPNAWGLYDMHGNVWEWTQDPWHEGYKGAPDNGSV